MQDQIYEIMCEIRASELRIASATEWIFFPSLQKQVSPLCSNPSSASGQLCQGIRHFSFNLNAHQLHTEYQQSDLMENN